MDVHQAVDVREVGGGGGVVVPQKLVTLHCKRVHSSHASSFMQSNPPLCAELVRYHPDNPVIVPDREWEGTFAMPFSGGAFWQDNESRIALWYRCGGGYALQGGHGRDRVASNGHAVGTGEHQGPNTTGTCLAFSSDGVSCAQNNT